MKRLIYKESQTELTNKQLDLGGKYFSLSNSGVSMDPEFLIDAGTLDALFNNCAAECGEEDEETNPFDQEAAVWRDRLKKDPRYVKILKEELPWLFK